MQTLKEYLAALGVLGKQMPESELASIKQAYYRKYHREYYRKNKNKLYRLELRCAAHEYAHFKKSAKEHKQKLSTHVRACALGYLNQTYVVPDESLLQELKMQIRAIGNNVNQIAYQANASGGKLIKAKELNWQLNKMEQLIETKIKTPPNLNNWMRDTILNSMVSRERLRIMLKEYDQ